MGMTLSSTSASFAFEAEPEAAALAEPALPEPLAQPVRTAAAPEAAARPMKPRLVMFFCMINNPSPPN